MSFDAGIHPRSMHQIPRMGDVLLHLEKHKHQPKWGKKNAKVTIKTCEIRRRLWKDDGDGGRTKMVLEYMFEGARMKQVYEKQEANRQATGEGDAEQGGDEAKQQPTAEAEASAA